jgi:UDP-N-acetylglucosamine--N-acetylmuramyl-(pentapeptide) pyrophosphoryl-undecaprenol N-acetylglucosamine transferase
MRILFTGGGTGGHIFPIIAVKRELDKIVNGLEAQHGKDLPKVFLEGEYKFVGGNIKEKREMLEREKIKTKQILSPKWRRYFSIKNFLDIFKVRFALLQALFLVWGFMPDAIFSKGGPGSVFIIMVGWLYRVPVIIHESDSVPGKTNKFSARFSKKIALSFKETTPFAPPQKMIFTGQPVRQFLLEGSKERAKDTFKLTSERKVILIIGGSQGAKQINLVFVDAIYKYIKDYEIIHSCGKNNFKELQLLTRALLKKKQRKFYHLYPALGEEKLKDAYSAADLIISRAGAGSLFEISAVSKPSIIIPLAGSASDHQTYNAQIFGQEGCGIIIETQNVSPNIVFLTAKDLLENEKKAQKLIDACKKFYKPDAAQKIAETIIKTA